MTPHPHSPGALVDAHGAAGHALKAEGHGGFGPDEGELDAQRNLDLVAILEQIRLVDFLAVDIGPIFAAQIDQEVSPVAALHLGVVARDLAFGNDNITVSAAANDDGVLVQNPALAGHFPLFDDKHGHVLYCHRSSLKDLLISDYSFAPF